MSARSLRIQALLFVGVFVAALGSGVILGRGTVHMSATAAPQTGSTPIATTSPTSQPAPDRGTTTQQVEHDPAKRLAAELGLTEDQQAKQKAIWDEAREIGRQQDEKRRAADKERDDEVLRLLTPEQKTSYEAAMARHTAARDQLNKEREDAFKKAQEEFKNVLTDAQRAKYEEIMKNRPPRRGGRGFGTSTTNRGAETRGDHDKTDKEKSTDSPRP